jgi:hypothetical protein
LKQKNTKLYLENISPFENKSNDTSRKSTTPLFGKDIIKDDPSVEVQELIELIEEHSELLKQVHEKMRQMKELKKESDSMKK